MTLVILAYRAVLPADLPVLFGILYNGFAGTKHVIVRCERMDNRSFYLGYSGFAKKTVRAADGHPAILASVSGSHLILTSAVLWIPGSLPEL